MQYIFFQANPDVLTEEEDIDDHDDKKNVKKEFLNICDEKKPKKKGGKKGSRKSHGDAKAAPATPAQEK